MIALPIVSAQLRLMSLSEFYNCHNNYINLRFEVFLCFLKKLNGELF